MSLATFSQCGEDGILSTGTSPVQLLTSNGSVVDQSSNFDVLISSQSGLVIGAKAPRIRLTLLGDRNSVVSATGGPSNLAET